MPAPKTADSTEAPRPVGTAGAALGLIVHDDLELRLKVADLLRRAGARQRFDSATRSAFDAMPIEAVRRYATVFLVVEFADAKSDPLVSVSRLHDQVPRMPIFVIARGGNERCAVRAIKSGATEYWPIHAIELPELSRALRAVEAPEPHTAPTPASENAGPAKSGDDEVPGYRLVKRLSKSDSGAVYLAEHSDSPMLVALKLQRIADVSDDHRQRFLRECELLSKLNHRSVADVIDFGVTSDFCYLALEYFPCGSLRERLRNPLSEAEAMNYALQIGEALRVVHNAAIVHRDLKPSNLMLTDDNRLVMIDFGLARSSGASAITHAGMSLGSPYYVSPEQIDGHEPDVRSDLYSFGIVLYEMLTGSLPFRGNSVADIVQQHRTASLPRLPAGLAPYQILLDRLLSKKPADRYASAPEVLSNLRALAANLVSRSNHS